MATATKHHAAKKAATKSAAPKSIETKVAENKAATTSTPDDTAARASAITDPNAEVTSSEAAAAQRQSAPETAESAKAGDEATPPSFPPGEAVNVAGIENLATLESRQRAKAIGDAADVAADPTAGEKGKATLRTVQKPSLSSALRTGEIGAGEEYDEVSVPAPDGIHEVVFARQSNGGVEISMQDVNKINSLRGGAHTTVVMLSEEAWNTIVDTLPGTQAKGDTPPAQSAAEQRAGAGEGAATDGPVAPHPVQL